MNERNAVMLGALAGAVAGGLVGYLFFTDRGRQLRENIEPRLADLLTEVGRAREAATRARDAASEGWKSVKRMDQQWPPSTPGTAGSR